ncbi:hypothetical protein P7L78_00045 (plasmid) [Tistrella bauzanensis]|uniref:Uncharacterized protein n=1 Tax=Tistrella arctica TaxID=3133430 RepID=A0ABU9YL44_9PROT
MADTPPSTPHPLPRADAAGGPGRDAQPDRSCAVDGWSPRALALMGLGAVALAGLVALGFSHRRPPAAAEPAGPLPLSLDMPLPMPGAVAEGVLADDVLAEIEAGRGPASVMAPDLAAILSLPADDMYQAGRHFHQRGDIATALVVWRRAAAAGSGRAADALRGMADDQPPQPLTRQGAGGGGSGQRG